MLVLVQATGKTYEQLQIEWAATAASAGVQTWPRTVNYTAKSRVFKYRYAFTLTLNPDLPSPVERIQGTTICYENKHKYRVRYKCGWTDPELKDGKRGSVYWRTESDEIRSASWGGRIDRRTLQITINTTSGDSFVLMPVKPSSLLRFFPVSQYLLEPASGVWALQFGC